MFKPLGLLSQTVVCPAHQQEHGSCDKDRSQCPFAHPERGEAVKVPAATETSSAVTANRAVTSPTPGESSAPASASAPKSTLTSTATRGTQPLHKKPRVNSYTPSAAAATASAATTDTGRSLAPSSAASTSSAQPFKRPPVITANTHPLKSLIPLSARNTYLKTLWAEYSTLYAPFTDSEATATLQEAGRKLAFHDALAQEAEIFAKAAKQTYKTTVVTTITGIRKRNRDEVERAADDLIDAFDADQQTVQSIEEHLRKSCTEVGTAAQVDSKRRAIEARAKSRLTTERLQRLQYVTPRNVLARSGYDVPIRDGQENESAASEAASLFEASTSQINAVWGTGSTQLDFVGHKKTCSRCEFIFTVQPASTAEQDGCIYHWGKKRFIKDTQSRSRIQQWTCCGQNVDGTQLGGAPSLSELAGFGGRTRTNMSTDSSAGCCTGPHVFKEEDAAVLHRMEAFVSTAEMAKSDNAAGTLVHDILALDCEMAYTTAGMDVTRVTVLAESGEIVLDQLIKPRADVLDTNVRFSGITPAQLEASTLPTLASLRSTTLASVISPNTILIGHGLENDLRTLRLVHGNVIDTALLFPHPRGPPMRQALKALAERYLQRTIQSGSGTELGHSSEEDAKAALDLVKYAAVREVRCPWGGSSSSHPSEETPGATATTAAPRRPSTAAPTKGVLIAGGKPRSTPSAGQARSSVLLSSGKRGAGVGGDATGAAKRTSPPTTTTASASTSSSRPSHSSSSPSNPLFIPRKPRT